MANSQNNLNAVFNDIATAINTKGVSGTMTPVEMADKINAIPSGSTTKLFQSALAPNVNINEYALTGMQYFTAEENGGT